MVELGTGLLDGVIRVSLPKKLTFELRFKWRDWPSAELGTVSGRGNGKGQDPSNRSSWGNLRGWRDEKKAAGSWTEWAGEWMAEVKWTGRPRPGRGGKLRPGDNPPSYLFSVNWELIFTDAHLQSLWWWGHWLLFYCFQVSLLIFLNLFFNWSVTVIESQLMHLTNQSFILVMISWVL